MGRRPDPKEGDEKDGSRQQWMLRRKSALHYDMGQGLGGLAGDISAAP